MGYVHQAGASADVDLSPVLDKVLSTAGANMDLALNLGFLFRGGLGLLPFPWGGLTTSDGVRCIL